MSRCAAVILALGWAGSAAAAAAREPDLTPLVAALRDDAAAHGVRPALVDEVFAGMAPDPAVAALARRQPEFAKPLGAYLASQVTAARVAAGQALVRRWAADLARAEQRFGVPPAILIAVWGLETNYGAAAGGQDVFRSMATLAALGVRPALYRAELLAAFGLLQGGEVSRGQLVGSWAGAMGQPQFMPSSFAAYAVDGDGDGRRDIWTDVPDALASIASFLQAKGWQAGRPWGFEVSLPARLDPAQGRAAFADWAARGVTRTDGAPLPADGEGVLFFPAGIEGPAFLVTANYEVIKSYNFSDAYVLAVASLADRIEGRPGFRGRWPAAIPMQREARIALQARLAGLGYRVDNTEGRVSLALRDTIRLAQASVGLVADGHPTDRLLKALAGAPPAR